MKKIFTVLLFSVGVAMMLFSDDTAESQAVAGAFLAVVGFAVSMANSELADERTEEIEELKDRLCETEIRLFLEKEKKEFLERRLQAEDDRRKKVVLRHYTCQHKVR